MTAETRTSPVPAPQDRPYPGTLKLHVDASDTRQGIFRVREVIPVRSGRMFLLYPKWIPGHHSPTGPIDKFAGLVVRANGKALAWQREKYDVYAFRLDVPKGVDEIEVEFQYLSARSPAQGPTEMTDVLLNLVWSNASLYPAGHFARQIIVEASVTLPDGCAYGSALREVAREGGEVRFEPVPYNVLVDSPLYAGRHAKRIDLDPDAQVPVALHLFADDPKYLEATDEQVQLHRNLVQQAYRLFESRHYAHYDFLLSLSDHLASKGVEHHQSSENGHAADYFTEWKNNAPRRDLLAHEFEHSWNGKFRRPADNWTPNFNVPMGDSLLWVYEGQTQYWGYVLTARSGLWTPEQYRDALAQVVARYDRGRPGFAWRGIEDTTNDPTVAMRASLPYTNWQMSEEYYNAGQLLWLWVDAKLRSLTGGEQSLDHFARVFFGVDDGQRTTKTYVFDDVVAALNGVVESDWAAFLTEHTTTHQPPLQGLSAAGWKLVYTDEASEYEKQFSKRFHTQPGFVYSIGLALGEGGRVADVRWNGPAWQAGVGSGEVVVAVNGQSYKPELLADAIETARNGAAPIELLLKRNDRYRSVPVAYHDGPQYARLERIEDAEDHLSRIIAPR
jgi:predicted metalloprotease with PDZ domain